ncbi:hypothetical protein GGR56DRAFT_642529 [Xylariaceae sp. FL0804]|nr:hypothetical protein GGR56DRAFT_642529 [Xylariaceae sp. FL0804]
MAHNPESEQHKRKRDAADDSVSQAHADRTPQPPPPQSGNSVPINYLSRAHAIKLKLIQGDPDTFSDALAVISDYEGVLNRHESLASNLGAKLAGVRLLKAMEGAFEGAITTIPPQGMFNPDPVTWLDIVEFARAKPGEFTLSATPSGTRCCQFSLKGVQVEINEDDWRLIVSGALDRFRLVPPQPLEEDENAEMATIEILEQRIQTLIKKADEVARRARQLNYHLSGRKASIHSRRSVQPGSGSGFQPVNPPRAGGASMGYDLHADLLQQFSTPSFGSGHRLSSVSSVPATPNTVSATTTPRTSLQQQPRIPSSRPSPSYPPEPATRDVEEENRVLAMSRVEKLMRGDTIKPPCDRCRRLRAPCIKHLTACEGCTKKHTKCTWKKLAEEEITWLRNESSGEAYEEDEGPRGHPTGSSFAYGSQPPVPAEPSRSGSERGDDRGVGQAASRIAIGRHADDVWRMVPAASSSSRDDPMEVDARDTRRAYGSEQSTYYGSYGVRPPADTVMRQVASAASARADAAHARRESQHPP